MSDVRNTPTINIHGSSSEDEIIPPKRMKYTKDDGKATNGQTMPYNNFSFEILCDIGQKGVECSGIAVAVLKMLQLRQLAVNNGNKNEIARTLLREGQMYYRLGVKNEAIEEANGHIELRAIYDSRNARNENVIDTSATSHMTMETAFTAISRPDDLQTYTEGTPNDSFATLFNQKQYGDLDNLVVCKRGLYGGHFISVVKVQERYLLVDGQGVFRFLYYNSLENLMIDLENFVSGCAFNLHSARFFENDLTATQNDLSTSEVANKQPPKVFSIFAKKKINEKAPMAKEKIGKTPMVSKEKVKIENAPKLKEQPKKYDEDMRCNKYGDRELPKDYDINYLGSTPIFSDQVVVRGTCAFENCNGSSTDGYCKDHQNQFLRVQRKMVAALRIKCAFPLEDCKSTIEYGQMFCTPHARKDYVIVKNQPTDQNKIKRVRAKIEEIILPLTKAGILVYVGLTSNMALRLNVWITSIRNDKIEQEYNVIMQEILTCRGVQEGRLLEKMFITECMLHEDVNVRTKLQNTSGGGQIPPNDYDDNTIFSIYVKFNKMAEITENKIEMSIDGNLSPAELMRCFYKIIEKKDVITHVSAGKFIYFGVSGTNQVFINRMTKHNVNGTLDRVSASEFSTCKLFEVGDKIGLKDGKRIWLNKHDIKKLEVIAIREFEYGRYSEYGSQLLNTSGGGDGGSDHTVLYHRYGSHAKAQKEKTKDDADELKYFSGTLPRDENNDIDWRVLVPRWKIVLHCGSKQRQAKEANFVCQCGKSYTTAKTLKRHQNQCDQVGGVVQKVICGYGGCEMELSSAQARKRHIERVHSHERNRQSVAQDNKYSK